MIFGMPGVRKSTRNRSKINKNRSKIDQNRSKIDRKLARRARSDQKAPKSTTRSAPERHMRPQEPHRDPGPLGRSSEGPESIAERSERLFRATKSTQERSKRPLRPSLSTKMARKGLRRAILIALGSIWGAPGQDFSGFFDGFSLEQTDSHEEAAT